MDDNYGQNQNWQNDPNQNPVWQDPYQSQQNQNNYSGQGDLQQGNGYSNGSGNPNSNMPNQGYANNGGYNTYAPNNYNGPIIVSNAVTPKSGGLAVGCLVCGIISIIGCWSLVTLILAIVGVVLGAVNNAQDQPNKVMAVVGIILNCIGFMLSILYLFIIILI